MKTLTKETTISMLCEVRINEIANGENVIKYETRIVKVRYNDVNRDHAIMLATRFCSDASDVDFALFGFGNANHAQVLASEPIKVLRVEITTKQAF